jgi:hypothetical protein
LDEVRVYCELPMAANELNISMQWRTAIVIEGGAGKSFPRKFTRDFCETYAIPAVYQWRVLRVPGESKEPVYIGEAEDFVYRIQRVLAPPRMTKKSNTNRRLNDIFTKYVAAGRNVALDIADVDPFEINGIRFGRDTMADRFRRRAIENLMLVIAQESGKFELLNMVVDPLNKVERLIRNLKPHEKREIMRRYSSDKTKLRGKT